MHFSRPLLLMLAIALLPGCARAMPGLSSDLVSAADPVAALSGDGAGDLTGYARAALPADIRFPRDQGAHPDYQTEWWYFTGNLGTADGRRFGYQFTIFRRALVPPGQRLERQSDWATDQVYMAHFAISDVSAGHHSAFERFSRGAAGLAGATAQPFHVWLEDWQVEELSEGLYRLSAAADDYRLTLELEDTKGPVLHGIDGYSQKGPQPGNASYYYSFTRLATSGELSLGKETFDLTGLSWMDHEYSTSALTAEQVGWDWFSLQLDGDSELMLFQIRRLDGSIDPYSGGTYVDPTGSLTRLDAEDFTIETQGSWASPSTGSVYPAGWRLTVPGLDLDLSLSPLISDQELDVTYAYWEGAVSIDGSVLGKPERGFGYVEMTGY